MEIAGFLWEAGDDSCGLWEVISRARRAWPNATSDQIRSIVRDFLTPFVAGGLVEVGVYSGPGTPFQAWTGPAADRIDKIFEAWIDPDQEPDLGDGPWFVATELGTRWHDLIK